jgi:hypothetical protein
LEAITMAAAVAAEAKDNFLPAISVEWAATRSNSNFNDLFD